MGHMRCRLNLLEHRSRIDAAFPFSGRGWRHPDVYKAFASRLGSAHPCTSAVSTEPFPTSVHPDRTSVFATTTKIGTRGCSMHAHAHTSTQDNLHAPLHLPSNSLERDEDRSHASAPSIFRVGDASEPIGPGRHGRDGNGPSGCCNVARTRTWDRCGLEHALCCCVSLWQRARSTTRLETRTKECISLASRRA